MPLALDPSTPMQFGGRYTFQFSQSAVPFVAANSNEIVAAILATVQNVSQVSVNGESTFGGEVSVNLTYNDQDNNDPVGDVGQQIALAMGSQFTLDSFTFEQAYGGDASPLGSPTADADTIESAAAGLGSTAILVALAIVGVVVAVKFL